MRNFKNRTIYKIIPRCSIKNIEKIEFIVESNSIRYLSEKIMYFLFGWYDNCFYDVFYRSFASSEEAIQAVKDLRADRKKIEERQAKLKPIFLDFEDD